MLQIFHIVKNCIFDSIQPIQVPNFSTIRNPSKVFGKILISQKIASTRHNSHCYTVYWILIAWMESELKYNHRSEMITRSTPTTAMHTKFRLWNPSKWTIRRQERRKWRKNCMSGIRSHTRVHTHTHTHTHSLIALWVWEFSVEIEFPQRIQNEILMLLMRMLITMRYIFDSICDSCQAKMCWTAERSFSHSKM